MPSRFSSIVRRGLPVALLLAAFAGCKRKDIHVYTAPKDVPFNPEPEATPHAQPPAEEREVWRPAVTYTVPQGWQDVGPDLANVARLSAGGGVNVAVTALPSMQGKEAVLVNMWRQVQEQAPLSDEEAVKTLKDVEIAGSTGKMFEGNDERDGQKRHFLVAFVHQPQGSLFFKVQGETAAVTAQQAAFFEFLKSVKVTGGTAPMPQAPPPAPEPDAAAANAAPPTPANLPVGWTVVEPGPMQVAKFRVPEKDGAKAEVAISIFPSDTGGVASNVKRWRGQIGLPEVDDATAAAAAKPIEGAPEGAVLIELDNAGRGLIGAIIPREGKWWFYKMLGDTPAVTAARDAFVVFAKAQP